MCFFFFQAEDGIRDFHVTGVQTCALPIFSSELAFTIRARLLESCPSLHSGKAPRRYSLASSSRTASPRNSRRSLSLGSTAATASSAPAERNSGTAELWVSALSRSSLAENL